MASQLLPTISPAEYLERERSAAFRSEYIFGQMYAMAGAPLPHNRVNRNVLTTLTSLLLGCEAISSDQRVYSPKTPFFAYPDTLVYCGQPELMPDQFQDTLMNPCLIVEVLSDSTRKYDLSLKFEMYRDIPTFREYLAIEPDFILIHHFQWTRSGRWNHLQLRSLDNLVQPSSVSGALPLSSIYRGIDAQLNS